MEKNLIENMVDMSVPKQGRAWVRDFDAEMPDAKIHTFAVPTIKEIIPLVHLVYLFHLYRSYFALLELNYPLATNCISNIFIHTPREGE